MNNNSQAISTRRDENNTVRYTQIPYISGRIAEYNLWIVYLVDVLKFIPMVTCGV